MSRRAANGQAQALAAAMTDTLATKQDLRELGIRMDARFEYLEKHLDTRLAEQEKRLEIRFSQQAARFDGKLASNVVSRCGWEVSRSPESASSRRS